MQLTHAAWWPPPLPTARPDALVARGTCDTWHALVHERWCVRAGWEPLPCDLPSGAVVTRGTWQVRHPTRGMACAHARRVACPCLFGVNALLGPVYKSGQMQTRISLSDSVLLLFLLLLSRCYLEGSGRAVGVSCNASATQGRRRVLPNKNKSPIIDDLC